MGRALHGAGQAVGPALARRWEAICLPASLRGAAAGAAGDGPGASGELRRARILLWSLTAVPFGLGLTWLLNRSVGRSAGPVELGTMGALLISLALLPLLRRGVPVRRVALLFAGLLTGATLVPVWVHQGTALPATLAVTTFPAVVMVLVGLRAAVLWCAGVVAVLTAMGFAAELRPELALPVPPEIQERWRYAVPILMTLIQTTLVALLELSRGRALRELESSQEALRESETRFRAIFEAAPVGMGLFASDGGALEANPRGRAMLGLSEGSALPERGLLDAVHPDDAERAFRYFARALRGCSQPPLECRWVKSDGRIEWAEAAASAVRGPDGAVRYVVGTADFITRRKEAEERIKALAFFDGITGLANRSLFVERLTRALVLAEKRHHPLAVLFMDLDGFKRVNDCHGHGVGDDVLALVAERFATCVRLSDQVGRLPDELHVSRFGGDEFTVLLSEVNGHKGAEVVARRLLASMERPFQVEDQEIYLGVSIGIAVYPDDGETVEALLRHADAAMYRVKREPHSGYHFFDAGIDAPRRER